MKIQRKLNVEETTSKVTRTFSNGVPYTYFNTISWGIGIDSFNRIWVITVNKIDGNAYENKFEIFDQSGILLGIIHFKDIPIKHVVQRSDMRIYGDRLFLIDPFEEMSVFEYIIIEK